MATVGKKHSKNKSRRISASAQGHKSRPQPKWRSLALGLAVSVVVVVLYTVLAGYVAFLPVVTVPLMTGALIGLVLGEAVPALLWGAFAGLTGSIAASIVFRPENYARGLDAMQPWMRPDITTGAFQALYRVVATNQINTVFGGSASPAYVLIVTLVSGLVAMGVAYVVVSRPSYRRFIEWGVVALACLCLVQSTYVGSAELRAQVAVEPTDGNYAYDPMFNVRTYYLMRSGQPFYQAYLYSIAKDQRYIALNYFHDGKAYGGSASTLREPLAFFVWRIAGYRSANGILWLSMLSSAAVLALSFAAFREQLGPSALVVPLALFPALMFHGMWLNVFFPDWWGALAFMASAFTLAMGRWRTSVALGVVAALFREVFCLWLLVAAVVHWVGVVRRRRLLEQAAWFSGGLVLAMVGYELHVMVGNRYIVSSTGSGSTILYVLKDTAAKSLTEKAWPAVYYLMSPYFMTVITPAVFLVLGAVGFGMVGLSKTSRAALAGYVIVTAAMYLTVGTHSSYWGQDVMPFAVAGSAVLVAWGLTALMSPESRRAFAD